MNRAAWACVCVIQAVRIPGSGEPAVTRRFGVRTRLHSNLIICVAFSINCENFDAERWGKLAVEMRVEEGGFDDDEKQRTWLEGCRREGTIIGLLERHGDKRLSMTDVDDVAWELGVSRSTLYRLIAAYRSKRTVSSVEPRSWGRLKNTFVLDRKREKLISMAIREIYLNPERPTMTYLIEQARAMRARRIAVAGSPNDQGAG